MAIRFASCFLSAAAIAFAAAAAEGPAPGGPIVAELQRLVPFGAMRGTTAEVELVGEKLATAATVWFDTPDIAWVETISAEDKKLRGKVRVAAGAALGPHLVHVRLRNGRSNSRLFNVTQFPSVSEAEPNDPVNAAPQRIELRPQVLHGYLQGLKDIDVYSFSAKAGERWLFDLRSLEYGSHLECDMTIEDEHGRRVAFNDDRDDYLETPLIEHTFTQSGVYRLKVDQYRGPQGVTCGSNCGYMLQISQLPLLLSASPLGGVAGSRVSVRIQGRALESATQTYLTRVRSGEYYRLTFPYSIPIRIGADPVQTPTIAGHVTSRAATTIAAEFALPPDAEPGLWRLWVNTPAGAADGISFEISPRGTREYSETQAQAEAGLGVGPAVVNATLDREREEDTFAIAARAGQPLHIWTLAVQLGLPYLDTVLELFDSSGKLVAEHDDLMTGQGTVIGNPDSSLYYTPAKDETLRLIVRDRIGRGGATYSYRLHFANEKPGFQLQTDPEEFTVQRGSHGELAALVMREPGFTDGVDIWVEGLPQGATATRGSIRAGQYFGPSDDGDNVIIPHAPLKITIPASLPPGDYPIRVLGRTASGTGPVVEAFTTLWIGPRGKRNDIRRPVPATTITVVE